MGLNGRPQESSSSVVVLVWSGQDWTETSMVWRYTSIAQISHSQLAETCQLLLGSHATTARRFRTRSRETGKKKGYFHCLLSKFYFWRNDKATDTWKFRRQFETYYEFGQIKILVFLKEAKVVLLVWFLTFPNGFWNLIWFHSIVI